MTEGQCDAGQTGAEAREQAGRLDSHYVRSVAPAPLPAGSYNKEEQLQ